MKPFISYAFLAAAAASGLAFGQTPVTAKTTPVGYTTTTVNGSFADGSRKNNIIGANLVNSPSYSGVVSEVAGDTVVFSNAALTAGAFNRVAGQRFSYYVETADGYWAHVVSNTASALTLPAGFASNFEVGDRVTVRRHITISDYFGENRPGFQASASGDAGEADQVILIDEENGGNITIIASDLLGGNWITDSFDNADNFPIYPDQGLQISRVGNADLNVVLTGEVDVNGRQIEVTTGINVRPIVLPIDVSLTELGLYTGDNATGLVPTSTGDASEADTVSVVVNGVSRIFFYSTSDFGSGAGWYDDSFNFVGDTPLPAGASLIINRTNPTNNAPFIWVNPAPVIQ